MLDYYERFCRALGFNSWLITFYSFTATQKFFYSLYRYFHGHVIRRHAAHAGAAIAPSYTREQAPFYFTTHSLIWRLRFLRSREGSLLPVC